MPQFLMIEGKRFVVIPQDEWERLSRASRLPELPEPDQDGNYPAVEYARASLARKLILRREAAGLSQAALARAAGMNVATLCRIESGKVTPTLKSIERLDRAINNARPASKPARKKARQR
jgi:ribosome-binding protein aMBF1 (putative translation factor)